MSSPTLHGEIESSRPLHAAGGKVSLVGWCLIAGQPAAPPIRLVTASHTLPMTARIARPDVASLLPGEPAAANSGFAIVGHLPAGLHHARFEVLLPDGTWQLFRQLTLAATAPPFTAYCLSCICSNIVGTPYLKRPEPNARTSTPRGIEPRTVPTITAPRRPNT